MELTMKHTKDTKNFLGKSVEPPVTQL